MTEKKHYQIFRLDEQDEAVVRENSPEISENIQKRDAKVCTQQWQRREMSRSEGPFVGESSRIWSQRSLAGRNKLGFPPCLARAAARMIVTNHVCRKYKQKVSFRNGKDDTFSLGHIKFEVPIGHQNQGCLKGHIGLRLQECMTLTYINGPLSHRQ